jgi:MGT family glycosyltransferase
MAHFAILCPEDTSHVLTNGAVGKELVERGHRVTVVAPEGAAPVAERLGLAVHVIDGYGIPYRTNLPLWLLFRPAGAQGFVEERNWLRWYAEMVLRLVPPALAELAVDGVLIDQTITAGGTAAERAGVPFVTLCTAVPWNEEVSVPPLFTEWAYGGDRWSQWRNRAGYAGWHWFIRPILDLINRYRKQWRLARLPAIEHTFSSLAQVSQLCAEFDFPRCRLPDVFHYVGSLTTNRRLRSEPPFPWERLDGRPLIFASLGSIAYDENVPMFRKILAACAGMEVQLVLGLGALDEADPVRGKLGEIPANALVGDFRPQPALWDRAALLVTHAGVNSVLEALSCGVPMVALPRGTDQPAMAARIAHAGVGLLGSFRRTTAWQLRELIERVLADEAFRQRAQAMQKALASTGGARQAAEIAERALLTRQPVRRPGTGGGPQQADGPHQTFADGGKSRLVRR